MSELEDFAPLNTAIDDLTARLQPGERRKLAGKLGTRLRTANAKRIKANVTPDGAAMAPRRSQPAPKAGKPRSTSLRPTSLRAEKAALMFRSAGKPQFLRRQASPDGIEVGFVGAMARIMRVHHFGLRDTITRNPESRAVTYDARPVIGLPPDDRLDILTSVTDHLGGR